MITRRSQRSERTSGRSQEGAISIMAAVLAVTMIMATSLAVDVGRVAYTSRDQQGATDRAVLDTLRKLPELHVGATGPDDVWEGVRDEILDSLDRNEAGSSVGTSTERTIRLLEIGFVDDESQFQVMWRDDPDEDDPESEKFVADEHEQGQPGPADDQWASHSVDTIRLSTHSSVEYVFGILADGKRQVHRQAMGTTDPTGTPAGCPPPLDPDCLPTPEGAEAGISIASRLLEVNTDNSPLLNAVFAGLLGLDDPIGLSVAGFDGLAKTSVPLGVLGEAGATVGTTEQLLESEVQVASLFTAMAEGARSDDAAVSVDAAQEALTKLAAAAAIDPALDVAVSDLVATTTEEPSALLLAEVNTADLVMNTVLNAAFANTDHFAEIQLSSLPGADLLGLEGLLKVTMDLTILQPPQMAYGKVGETTARTAQIGLDVVVDVKNDALGELLGGLTGLLDEILCIPIPLVRSCGSSQLLDVSVVGAQAEAELTGIACTDPLDETDITTTVSSDALVVSVDDEPVLDRESGGGTVVIPTVPGEAGVAIDDAALTDIALLDTLLEPALGLLGISTGTAYAASHVVNCDVPVLLPNP